MREKGHLHLPFSPNQTAFASNKKQDPIAEKHFLPAPKNQNLPGTLSDFVIRPGDFIDHDEISAPSPPIENSSFAHGLPTTRSYKRPARLVRKDVPQTPGPSSGGLAGAPMLPPSDSESLSDTGMNPARETGMRPVTPKTPVANVAAAKPRRKFRSSDYLKALEPKVMLPFESRPGQTPRRIEIERKKRLFSQQNIAELIHQALDAVKREFDDAESLTEGTAPRESIMGLGDFLPLEYFDNTEFEPRAIHEWLDMETYGATDSAAAPDGASVTSRNSYKALDLEAETQYATIPVPACAFDGRIWRDCLVMAYNMKSALWKVRWRTFSGWDLIRKGQNDDDDDVSDSEEEEEADEYDPGIQGEAEQKQKEAWVHR